MTTRNTKRRSGRRSQEEVNMRRSLNLELTKSMRWGDIFELVKSSFMSIDRRDDFSAILNISEYKLQGIMTWNDLTAVDSTFDTAFNASNLWQGLLFIASQHGNVDAIEMILEAKGGECDVNQTDIGGASPMWHAARYGQITVAKFLLENGGDVNQAMNDGATPVFVASQNGHTASPQAPPRERWEREPGRQRRLLTRVHCLVKGHTAALKLLLENGGDANQANNNGAHPCSLPRTRGTRRPSSSSSRTVGT